MILYHGSNLTVDIPKLIQTQRLLDFGKGFYLTSDLEQANRWAVRTTNRREEGEATVSAYQVDEDELHTLDVLTFHAPDQDWLRYITVNRTGKQIQDSHDIVIGPVANDQAIRTVNQYLRGYFPEDVALRLLLPQKLKDQYAFKTEAALQILHFSGVVTL